MICETLPACRFVVNEKAFWEATLIGNFLDAPSDRSFTDLYEFFTPQLIAFYRARKCDSGLSEDLAQLVMLTVYRKDTQVRDRPLFRGWLFKIARNTLCRHYGRQAREVQTVNSEQSVDRLAIASTEPAPTTFEFLDWMGYLNPREREVMMLRFIEQWEYHEIAAARDMPIGTVRWIVFNAKEKLAPRLVEVHSVIDHLKSSFSELSPV